jgi:hypothetical protein
MHRRKKSKAMSATKAKGQRGGRKRHGKPPSASSASSSGRRARAATKSARKRKSRKRNRSSSSSTARHKRARRTSRGAAGSGTSASCSSSASADDEATTSGEGDEDEDSANEDEDGEGEEDEDEDEKDEEDEEDEADDNNDENEEEEMEGNDDGKEDDDDDTSNEDATSGALSPGAAAMQRYVVDTTAILGNQASNKTAKDVARRAGAWFLLENAHNGNLLGDVAGVDYCAEAAHDAARCGKELIELTPVFCDNIMLFSLVPETQCEDTGSGWRLRKTQVEKGNAAIRDALRELETMGAHTHKTGVKVKIPILYDAGNGSKESNYRRDVNKIMLDAPNIEATYAARYGNPARTGVRRFVVPWTVDLADFLLEALLQELPMLLDELAADGIYLYDFDVTQDFGCIFRKAELRAHLLAHGGFHEQGDGTIGLPRLLKNDRHVGRDCLTWLDNLRGRTVRAKVYNKFVCQVTSPAVTKSIGNHLVDFLDCPDARLRATFADATAKATGITRLEATISGGRVPTRADLQDILQGMRGHLEGNGLFYAVPFAEQWAQLAQALTGSCVLYNATHRTFDVGLYADTETRKITGLHYNVGEKCPQSRIAHLQELFVSYYSLDSLPCHLVVATELGDGRVCFEKTTFMKTGGATIVTRSNSPFSSVASMANLADGERLAAIADAGMPPTPFITVDVHTRKRNPKSACLTRSCCSPTTRAFPSSCRSRRARVQSRRSALPPAARLSASASCRNARSCRRSTSSWPRPRPRRAKLPRCAGGSSTTWSAASTLRRRASRRTTAHTATSRCGSARFVSCL